MVAGFTTTYRMQSEPITTKYVSLNPAHGEVYSIKLYVDKAPSIFDLVFDNTSTFYMSFQGS